MESSSTNFLPADLVFLGCSVPWLGRAEQLRGWQCVHGCPSVQTDGLRSSCLVDWLGRLEWFGNGRAAERRVANALDEKRHPRDESGQCFGRSRNCTFIKSSSRCGDGCELGSVRTSPFGSILEPHFRELAGRSSRRKK